MGHKTEAKRLPSFSFKHSEEINTKKSIYLDSAYTVQNTKQRARTRLGLTGSQRTHTVQKTVTRPPKVHSGDEKCLKADYTLL